MKLNPEQLSQHLQQPLLPVYLLSGDEPLLIQEAGDALRQAARQQGFEEREVMHAESGYQWEDLLNSANAMSLFAARKIIELHIPNGKPGTKGAEMLGSYLASPSPDTLLLIFCPRLDGASQKSKWFKAIDQAGATLAFWPIDSQRLPGWIQQRFTQQGMNVSREAANLLADRVEGNLLAAVQEIEKLKLVYPEQTIAADDILNAVADSARYDLFNLSDTALAGQSQRCLRMLSGLQAEGTDATLVLWALARDIRMLLELKQSTGSGAVNEAQFRQHRIWGKRKSLVNRALSLHTCDSLQDLLHQCGDVDQAIKGMSRNNPWLLLTDISLQLARS